MAQSSGHADVDVLRSAGLLCRHRRQFQQSISTAARQSAPRRSTPSVGGRGAFFDPRV